MIEQRTEAWHQARMGKVTASRVADLMAKTKSGPSSSRANYMATLIVERLTGVREEGFTNAAMIWGVDTEPQARAAYEFLTDATVIEEGFVLHQAIPDFGASPDGLVGDVGLLEIKCPQTAAHLDVLLSGEVPGKYVTQMQAQMACTGRAWCDFVSFDPRMPGEMQLFVKRVHRDEVFIAAMEGEIAAFLAELAQKLDALRDRYQVAA
jgi:putative phage-type endonuclease